MVLKVVREQLFSLEEQYHGFIEHVARFETLTLPTCPVCGSELTAKCSAGIIGRTLALTTVTSKFKLTGYTRPAAFYCRDCGTLFEADGTIVRPGSRANMSGPTERERIAEAAIRQVLDGIPYAKAAWQWDLSRWVDDFLGDALGLESGDSSEATLAERYRRALTDSWVDGADSQRAREEAFWLRADLDAAISEPTARGLAEHGNQFEMVVGLWYLSNHHPDAPSPAHYAAHHPSASVRWAAEAAIAIIDNWGREWVWNRPGHGLAHRPCWTGEHDRHDFDWQLESENAARRGSAEGGFEDVRLG